MRKYESDESRRALAREIAREAIVLLKNDGLLPLSAGKKIALLGQTQFDTVIGGSGSGASYSESTLQIETELSSAGLVLEENLLGFYADAKKAAAEKASEEAEAHKDFFKSLAGMVASGAIYEWFGRYTGPQEEPVPSSEMLAAAAENTDTAVLIIGRKSGGEECDRHIQNDYYLTESEAALAKAAAENFAHVAVIFNVNGAVDTAWMRNYPSIEAAIFMGTCGEQAAGALADILTGKISPSGRLSQTLALSYEDYPTADTISSDKDDPSDLKTYETYGLSAAENGSTHTLSPAALYKEGIFVGYRYFDTFNKEVMFPFGHGLSYASFEITKARAAVEAGKVLVTANVRNTSDMPGKEVLQLYVSAPSLSLTQPEKQLKAFGKTPLLSAGESVEMTLQADLTDLASFSEEEMAYILEPGTYRLLLGNSSKNVFPVSDLLAEEKITVRKVSARIGLRDCNRDKIGFLTAPAVPLSDCSLPCLKITASDFTGGFPTERTYNFSVPAVPSVLKDVREGRVSMEAFINQMSTEELAVLLNGYGPGLPFGGLGADVPSTINYEDGTPIGTGTHPKANPGYMNPALEKYGIYSAYYKDGPASCGKTAWPTGMMTGCTFNADLMYEFGMACGYEAETLEVDSWLAPGMNIIRNPIEGRAFEYISEDPMLSGILGTAIARGAAENNDVTVCPKHFALNEQETYRRGKEKKDIDAVDTIVDERTAREIYLKPFEMVLTQAKPRTLMTSFNKINGTFAAGNHALCTEILRGEWGFDGAVVTDWGDMDFVVDGADAVAAGNDVVMPGGPPVIAQMLKGYEEGRVSPEQMKTAAAHILNFVAHTRSQNIRED